MMPFSRCCDKTPLLFGRDWYYLCGDYQAAVFWVNRKSYLSEALEGGESAKEDVGKSKTHLRAEKCCGMTCKPHEHGKNHVVEISQPDATKVCKQIRADTLPNFYGSHTFIFTIFDIKEDGGSVTAWLETIGPKNTNMLLRRIVIV